MIGTRGEGEGENEVNRLTCLLEQCGAPTHYAWRLIAGAVHDDKEIPSKSLADTGARYHPTVRWVGLFCPDPKKKFAETTWLAGAARISWDERTPNAIPDILLIVGAPASEKSPTNRPEVIQGFLEHIWPTDPLCQSVPQVSLTIIGENPQIEKSLIDLGCAIAIRADTHPEWRCPTKKAAFGMGLKEAVTTVVEAPQPIQPVVRPLSRALAGVPQRTTGMATTRVAQPPAYHNAAAHQYNVQKQRSRVAQGEELQLAMKL